LPPSGSPTRARTWDLRINSPTGHASETRASQRFRPSTPVIFPAVSWRFLLWGINAASQYYRPRSPTQRTRSWHALQSFLPRGEVSPRFRLRNSPSNSLRSKPADAGHENEIFKPSREDRFHRTVFFQQAGGTNRTYGRQSLQNVQLGPSLRLGSVACASHRSRNHALHLATSVKHKPRGFLCVA